MYGAAAGRLCRPPHAGRRHQRISGPQARDLLIMQQMRVHACQMRHTGVTLATRAHTLHGVWYAVYCTRTQHMKLWTGSTHRSAYRIPHGPLIVPISQSGTFVSSCPTWRRKRFREGSGQRVRSLPEVRQSVGRGTGAQAETADMDT